MACSDAVLQDRKGEAVRAEEHRVRICIVEEEHLAKVRVPRAGTDKGIRVRLLWGVAKGSSVSWVAKFKRDKNSECKLSNGRSRSYKVINCFFLQGNE